MKLVTIKADDGHQLADMTVYEPLASNTLKVDEVTRMVANIMMGRETTLVDLGMNSQYIEENGVPTIRFRSLAEGGNSIAMMTIIPKDTRSIKSVNELGMAIAGGFVRDESPYVPPHPIPARKTQQPRL